MSQRERFPELPRQIVEANGDRGRLVELANLEPVREHQLGAVRRALSERLRAPIAEGGASYSGVDARAITDLLRF